MKPTDPHTRTRPYLPASSPWLLVSRWASEVSYSGTTPLLARNSKAVTAATGHRLCTCSKDSPEATQPTQASRMRNTRRPVWSPSQPQA